MNGIQYLPLGVANGDLSLSLEVVIASVLKGSKYINRLPAYCLTGANPGDFALMDKLAVLDGEINWYVKG